MLYTSISQKIQKPKQLISLLPKLALQINEKNKLIIKKMNQQQIMSQIHTFLQQSINKYQHQKDKFYKQNNLNQHDWSIQQNQNQQISQENKEQIQNDEQNEQQLDNEEQNQEESEQKEHDYLDEPFEDEEDVGLYGQQIQQDMESYENEADEQQQKQFQYQQKKLNKSQKRIKRQQQDAQQEILNDQFDQFRQIQFQANKPNSLPKEQTDIQKQIEKLQNKILEKKDWVVRGQVKAHERPTNSLLQVDLQYSTGIKLSQQVTPQYNSDLQKMIRQRILDELYDDRQRYQQAHVLKQQFGSLKQVSREKSKMGLAQIYETDFKNFLGLSQNKNQSLKKQIYQSFKQLNYYLDSLSNARFVPRPTSNSMNQLIISQQKVPLTVWKENIGDADRNIKTKIQSQKQQNNKQKRIKNKRIVRQRVKQQIKKKINKKIEFGGMTKFQAKAAIQRNKNNLNITNIKYNKSANFFGEMNQQKKNNKPNPNINKLKI